MNDETNYLIEWCPVCHQGWIEIVKEKNSKKLFVYCNECETEWASPEYIKIKDSGTFGNYGEIESPTYEEVLEKGWDKFLQKKAD